MKPCIYCKDYDYCPIAGREDMVADWCPYDQPDVPLSEDPNPATKEDCDRLPF